MLIEEEAAVSWLSQNKGICPGDIKKNNKSPDFLTPVGGYEVKRLSGGKIVFSCGQLIKLDSDSSFKAVLVFNGREFISEIPASVIKARFSSSSDVRIYYDETRPTISTRVSPAMFRQLTRISKETGRKMGDITEEALLSFIGMYNNAVSSRTK